MLSSTMVPYSIQKFLILLHGNYQSKYDKFENFTTYIEFTFLKHDANLETFWLSKQETGCAWVSL